MISEHNASLINSSAINSTKLLLERESITNPITENLIRRRLQSCSAYIDALEQEALLQGHEGCVNCLEWSSDERLLASGSDDLHVMLWNPFRKKKVHSLRTKHTGNMFSVKFLPCHNDNIIATGAADKHIYVYDINRNNEIMCCNCHSGRVKRLATAPDSPSVFWSAAEDGNILQIDIRESHKCRDESNRVLLLNLSFCLGPSAEAKCLAINPRRTEFLAVGANDPYARIYDRRMIKLTSCNLSHVNAAGVFYSNGDAVDKAIPKDCVAYYSPGHINKNNSRLIEHESRAITYLTFNAAGTELLVNTGGEHIYLYDLAGAQQPTFLNLPEYKAASNSTTATTTQTQSAEADFKSNEASTSTQSSSASSPTNPPATVSTSVHRRKLPEHIEAYKKVGNDLLENEKYLHAINQYSEAISMAPACPVLYLNRATAYMRRQWFGDVYAALRDCHEALRLDPSYIKAHFRLARALLELERPSEADQCLKELINRFPSYATNHGVLMLHKDIKENRRNANQNNNNNSQGSPDSPLSYMELSDNEFEWRDKAKDYSQRFVGHCNTTTDIKEANFLGHDGDFIVAGSDDGNLFIWERKTGNVRSIYKADGAIVNCVQPHPSICMLATSGIDHDIKIWTPNMPAPQTRTHLVSYVDKCIEENQQKMKTDPFDLNSRNAFCWNG